jgi:diaminohydroxyphosphoribosylaminopyrimidine deaminase / 5-amino-6-(5-phosphoribosylamino)uracil reductase
MQATEAQALALALAEQAVGLSDPNPRVGCVLLDAAGKLLGQGHTQQAGGPHAEVMALRDAAARGHVVRGATAVVTLEPCSHTGRTPPCCDALIDHGITRVVAAAQDPNPLVAGQGLQRLRAAGMQVALGDAAWAQAARELNIGFFSRMVRQRPWVRMKIAASLDGRTALNNGVSQWITGEAARTDSHAWRRRAQAVLTGIGTVRQDDPRLDVRLVPTQCQPLRVVVDSTLAISPAAKILAPPGKALIYTTRSDAPPLHNAEIATLPTDAQGKNDLAALVADLATRGVNELHVEAGEKLNGSLLRAGLVDELLLYIAPRLIGPGRSLAALPELTTLQDSLAFEVTDVATVGPDIRLRLRRPAAAEF